MMNDNDFLKVSVKGNEVVVRNRIGEPVLRSIADTPLHAIKNLRKIIDAKLESKENAK